MGIYQSIKKTGAELCISYNPTLTAFKKEAKTLYKEEKNKSEGLSLMQCQEQVARRHGFENWYHITQLLKKRYETPSKPTDFIYTPDQESAPEHLLMGQDTLFQRYVWQSRNAQYTHHLILGEHIYKRYDVYLAQQAIHNHRGVFFMDSGGDYWSLEALAQAAQKAQRLDHLKIITPLPYTVKDRTDFRSTSISNSLGKHYYQIENNIPYTAENTITLFKSFMRQDFRDSLYEEIFTTVLTSLVAQRDKYHSDLSLEKIQSAFSLKNIYALTQTELPMRLLRPLLRYFDELGGTFNGNHLGALAQEYHTQTFEAFLTPLETLRLSGLFAPVDSAAERPLIPLDKLLTAQTSVLSSTPTDIADIVYFYLDPSFNEEHQTISQFILETLKLNVLEHINRSVFNTQQELLDHIREPNASRFIFIRESFLPSAIGIFPALFRAFGISLTFSYRSYHSLTQLSAQQQETITANTMTKIFSPFESESTTLEFFNQLQHKGTLATLTQAVDNTKPMPDLAWLVKKNELTPVSFNSPYKPQSIVASYNVKTYMKLEDPEETFKLFEDIAHKDK